MQAKLVTIVKLLIQFCKFYHWAHIFSTSPLHRLTSVVHFPWSLSPLHSLFLLKNLPCTFNRFCFFFYNVFCTVFHIVFSSSVSDDCSVAYKWTSPQWDGIFFLIPYLGVECSPFLYSDMRGCYKEYLNESGVFMKENLFGLFTLSDNIVILFGTMTKANVFTNDNKVTLWFTIITTSCYFWLNRQTTLPITWNVNQMYEKEQYLKKTT